MEELDKRFARAQCADVLLYLRDRSMNVEQILQFWLERPAFLAIVPLSATPQERALFAGNAGLILKLLQNGHSSELAALAVDKRALSTSILTQVVSAVHAQYTNPNLSLKTLSGTVNFSERHMRRLFKELMGQTFCQCLRYLRISEAARRLASTTDDVKAIAGAVGYGDRSHFSRDFRMLMGCTPLEFRSNPDGKFMSDLSYRKSVLAY